MMVGEDELVERFKPFMVNWECYDDIARHEELIIGDAKRCAEIAIQYHKSKLEELEKWIDTDCNWLQDSTIKLLKAKIKSLIIK